MRASTRDMWNRANVIADCDCATRGYASNPPDETGEAIISWTSWNEFWNTATKGHLIASSLCLDGVDAAELP